MKFDIMIIARDEGWRPSQNVKAVLTVQADGEWLALEADDQSRVKGFMPTRILELLIGDGHHFFRWIPEHGNPVVKRNER